MQRIFILGLIVFTFFSESYAQSFDNEIYGIVEDINTGKPLSDVNIFISHSSWGTTSDINGNFRLSSIRPGKHELVFSIIGYATQSKSIYISDTSKLYIKTNLHLKVYEFEEVLIVEERPEEWFDDLEDFKRKFLGYSKKRHNCKITNENLIDFLHPKENILVAKCNYPLIIFNFTLGYKIECEIQEFEYDKWSGQLKQNYRLFYSELDTSDINVKDGWLKNRRAYHRRSLYFFFKKLISNDYAKENFSIALVSKPRIIRHLQYIEVDSSSEILSKNNITDTYELSYTDYLQVEQYDYYRSPKISWIKLNYPFITIDNFGYPLEDFAVTLFGYWAKLGVASSLPKDYENTENNE